MARRISLALQGGGAHGAFTWGVLDRLLEEDDLEIAAHLGHLGGGAERGGAEGRADGGRAGGARRSGWTGCGRRWARSAISAWRPGCSPSCPPAGSGRTRPRRYLPVSPQGIAAQLYSPYALGAAWENPLDPVVRDLDFSQVCAGAGPQLFVSATNVRTGKIRVFEAEAITPEVLLASACLPTVFQAVEIWTARAYWDGGYSGNPALFPLYEPDLPDDILVVSINPMRREEVPDTPLEIQNRINEISFNACLLGELRAINFVRRLIAEGRMERGRMKDVRVHMIADDGLMNELSATTKLAPSPQLLVAAEAGRAGGGGRVPGATCGDKIGREPSVDLPELLTLRQRAAVFRRGIDEAARDDQLGRVVDRHVHERSALSSARTEACPMVKGVRPDKDGRHVGAQQGQPLGQLALGAGGHEAERPGRRGAETRPGQTLSKLCLLLVEEGLGHLLDRAVDRPDDRHPVDQVFARGGSRMRPIRPLAIQPTMMVKNRNTSTPTPRTGNSYSGPNQRPISASGW